MTTKPARISISLWFECPHCKEALDLFDEADCPETGGADNVAWSMVKEWLDNRTTLAGATCGKCEKEITINEVEW